MKKIVIIFIALLAYLSIYAQTYSDRTYSKTVMLGKSITLNPYSDLGVSSNYFRGCSYTISDNSAFTINSESVNVGTSSSPKYYYKYTLTALKTGVYTFVAKISYQKALESNYSYAYATYTINVVEVTGVSIPSSLSLTIGDVYAFSPIISQQGATTTLSWNSSNPNVGTITNMGVFNALGEGNTIITCTTANGISSTCTITVNSILTNSITLNETEAELIVGESFQLSATIAPDNATNKSVTWSSTNEAVAVVDENGLMTAVGSGTCQVRATANDGSGKTASCLVTVEKNNKLTVTDMTQCSGGRGVLNVLLSDEETIMGFQFDLELPAGVTVAEDANNTLRAQLTGNAVNTHSISSSKISDGLYRFVVTPQGSRAISNASGDGMTITIDVADEVATGTYQMTIKDIEMTVRKAGNVYEDIHPKNSTATLTVTEAVMGDVNGDGRVSVTDVISMNSYILEEEPAQFIRKVADLNNDGKVTITDMVLVIDIILGR